MIKEVGIFINGMLLVNRGYDSYETDPLDKSLICSLISAIEIFYRNIFSEKLQYVKGERTVLVFSKTAIKLPKYNEKHHVIAYIIIDNNIGNIDAYITKIIHPQLQILLHLFKNRYPNPSNSKASKFNNFKKEIDNIFIEV